MRRLSLICTGLSLLPLPATAQFASVARSGSGQPQPSAQMPVTFQADQVQYDRTHSIVTASGHVMAWQNGYVLSADKVTFNRVTGVASASGHVTLVQPDGQVLFSNYAELSGGMRDGVLRGMSALLAENGKLVANGGRRIEGAVNELADAVYSTCNLCAKHPDEPALWDLRARSAVQDTQHKRIEYKDAWLDIYGVPVMYFPYFWHADPSAPRASGFLVPSIGTSKHIGGFFSLPYFWAIDGQSDATITPMFTTETVPNLEVQYRRRFNSGAMTLNGSLGYLEGAPQASIFAKGDFDYNDEWRYGFNINRASSVDYLRDFRFTNWQNVLTSQVYAEGFGEGAYARLDARAYQSLTTTTAQSALPYVLPRYEYSFFGQPDAWGGRFSANVSAFNVLRGQGTNTQRAAAVLDWQKPMTGRLGDVWNIRLNLVSAAYIASDLTQQPNFASTGSATTARAQPTAAVEVRWPLVRDAGALGSQVIEPIAQIIVAPNADGRLKGKLIPNEDSLDPEFTDANLFALNRFPGIDRLEGGLRANLGLHAAWYMGGTLFDGLIGQSYREHRDNAFPVGSGLRDNVSDVVGHLEVSPSSWLDVMSRFRLDKSNLDVRFADVVASAGQPLLRLSTGYLYSNTNPYYLYDQAATPLSYFTPRNEVSLGASTQFGHWKFSASARRDIQRNRMVDLGFHGTYEDECFIFDASLSRRYTSIDNDNGGTTVLFQITFKTVGQVGFHAF